jgi:hypothetical protein
MCRSWAAASWLAILSFLLLFTICTQSIGDPPGPAEAAGSGAGVAECSVFLRGGKDPRSSQRVILRAGMRCTGPQPTIALASEYMVGHKANFTGVKVTSNCSGDGEADGRSIPSCLVTICDGGIVLRTSSVARVKGLRGSLDALVCVLGDSTVSIRNSRLVVNGYTPLAVSDRARLVLHASNISYNVVVSQTGGILAAGNAHVTIGGGSRMHTNTAVNRTCEGCDDPGDGGALSASDSANVVITGASEVHGNTAEGSGGGLHVVGGANVTLAGGSSVCNNTAYNGGGLYAEGAR